MKKILTLFVVLLSGHLYSQTDQTKVFASKKYDHYKTFNFNYIQLIELDNKNSVLIQPDSKNFTINWFDENANKINEKIKFELEKNQKYQYAYDIGNGKLLAIIVEDGKNNKKMLARKIDLHTGKFESDAKLMLDVENAKEIGCYASDEKEYFKQLVVTYTTSVTGKTKELQKNFAVFDANLDLKYKIKVDVPEGEYIDFIQHSIIDNKLVLIVISKKERTNKLMMRKPSKEVKIRTFVYSEIGELEKKFNVENDKESYIGLFSIAVVNNSLNLVTSYSDSEDGLVKGFASFSVDVNGTANPKLQYDEIGEELMYKYAIFEPEIEAIKASYKSNKNKTKYNYLIKKVVKHDKGYYAIIQQQSAIFLNGQIVQHQEIWYRDFIIASYDLNNKLKWIRKAPVLSVQVLLSDWGWNYVVQEGNLIIVHPHLQTNYYPEPDNPKKKEAKGDYLIMQKLDRDGNLSREIIFDLKKELDLAQFTSYSDSNHQNSITFLGYARDQYHIVRVDLSNK